MAKKDRGLVIRIEGDEAVMKKINKIAGRAKARKPLHKLWGAFVLKWTIKNFEQEGKLTGSKWKPLSPITIQKRRRGTRPGRDKILQDTGTLRKSFVFDADTRRAKIGSPTSYAPPHQFGARFGGLRIPKRPMLPPEFKLIKKNIEGIGLDYVMGRPIRPRI